MLASHAPNPASSTDPHPHHIIYPSAGVRSLVRFCGSDNGKDAMSLAASEGEDWSSAWMESSTPLQNEMEEHSKAELLHVISKTVEELGLEWSPPVKYVCSWLDDWFLQSCHHQRAKG